MAYKQNLPVYGFFFIVAGGVFAALIYLQPSDEDRLNEAVVAHAQAVGAVGEVEREGPLATYRLKDGSVIHVEFDKKDGKWVLGRDLFKEFERTVSDPRVEAEILGRLTKRLADRFRANPEFKEAPRKVYVLTRDPDGSLVGQVEVRFQYPGAGESRPSGRYAETFRYSNGQWTSEGGGSLMDQAGP